MLKAPKLVRVVVLLVIVVVAGLVLVILNLNRIVKLGVEQGGARILGVDTTLDGASVSILGGTAGLDGLTLGSPEGFNAERMFYLGHAHVAIEPLSVMGDEVVVHEVVVDGAEAVLELSGGKSNWGTVMERVGREPSPEEKESERTIRIDRVSFTNGTLGLRGIPVLGDARVPLPDVVITEGLSTADGRGVQARVIMKAVIAGLYKAVVEAAGGAVARGELRALVGEFEGLTGEAGGIVRDLKEALGEGPGSVQESAEDAADTAREAADEVLDGVEEGVDAVKDALGGLLGGKD
jgi:hypothetical protein